ncbi:Hypothetical protein ETEE_3200 [Edwardsiella anguillarum ET080813]|uniref:Uncharacterized protein n=1 Tax=Edwardsiella anguillarum ET080813 TaxID=667120 RepID=A0A076LP27_9GAMM|nr:Hypothetical protein ETEE_3200 [Edwardsiella anguillarum ET080813]
MINNVLALLNTINVIFIDAAGRRRDSLFILLSFIATTPVSTTSTGH